MKKEWIQQGHYNIKYNGKPDYKGKNIFRLDNSLFSRLWNILVLARLILSGDLELTQPTLPLSYLQNLLGGDS